MPVPNILILLTDQQAASTVTPDSACELPNVNRVADEGTRFSRCYSSNPICSPSRASMLTGVLPHVHGMVNVTHGVEPYGAKFRNDVETWSERLSALGYHLGYFGKWHIERSGDLEQFGFNEYDIHRSDSFTHEFSEYRDDQGVNPIPTENPDELLLSKSVSDPGYEDYLLYGVRNEPPETSQGYYTYSQAIRFIHDAAGRDEPWGAVVSTDGPHDPYIPPASVYERCDFDGIAKPKNFHDPMQDKPTIYRRQRAIWDDLSWEEYAEATACYYAFCSHIDDQVGRILNTLETTDQLENTVIIYASDHGDLMGAHGMFLKGVPAFEECYHIPLIIRYPNRVAGQVREEIVQFHDLAPTLVEIGGSEEPFPSSSRLEIRNAQARGRENIEALNGKPSFAAISLVPFLRGSVPGDHREEAFAEFHGQDFTWTQRVYWNGDHKYVFNTFAEDELYDLNANPSETMNLVNDPEYDSIKADLAGRMWEIARETGDYQIAELHYGMHRFAPVGPFWSNEN